MSLVTIQSSETGATAEILVDRGFNCVSFRLPQAEPETPWECLDTLPEFRTGGGRPSGNGIPILFPFPNRIANGRFSWRGNDYGLNPALVPQDALGNAIHGFCLDRPWRILEQSPDRVTGVFQLSIDAPDRRPFWPADFRIEVTYAVIQHSLAGRFRIINPDDQPLPWGLGTHAYFRLPLSPRTAADDCLLQAPVDRLWVLEQLLPTGELAAVPDAVNLTDGIEFGGLKLDHVFAVAQNQGAAWDSVIMDPAAGRQIVQRCGAEFQELVAFTPPGRNAVCLEPYTCVTNAINLEASLGSTGLQVLPPGQETTSVIEIFAGPVLV